MKTIFKTAIILVCFQLMSACGGSNNNSSEVAIETEECNVTDLEQQMDALLSSAVSEVDFSYTAVRSDGRQYTFNKGASTLQTAYESASTSKLVTGVVILYAIEQGHLSLDEQPQDYIATWPILNSDSLYAMNLRHLLSFTSGLEDDPFCINNPIANYENCVIKIADDNANNGVTPGEGFYYAGGHMHVAGMMAYKAAGLANWTELFSAFKTANNIFANSSYNLPSASNPRIAGGMTWTGDEYMEFLLALMNGEILNESSMDDLLTNHTASAITKYSPTVQNSGQDWQYGLGLWHECENATFDCNAGDRVSSPGAFGAYPFWDRVNNYVGLLARQGSGGTSANGITTEKTVRTTAEAWATCL